MTVNPTGTEQPVLIPAEVHQETWPERRLVITIEPAAVLAHLDINPLDWSYDETTGDVVLGNPVGFLAFEGEDAVNPVMPTQGREPRRRRA